MTFDVVKNYFFRSNVAKIVHSQLNDNILQGNAITYLLFPKRSINIFLFQNNTVKIVSLSM